MVDRVDEIAAAEKRVGEVPPRSAPPLEPQIHIRDPRKERVGQASRETPPPREPQRDTQDPQEERVGQVPREIPPPRERQRDTRDPQEERVGQAPRETPPPRERQRDTRDPQEERVGQAPRETPQAPLELKPKQISEELNKRVTRIWRLRKDGSLMEKRYMRAIPLLIGEAYSKALYNAIIKDEILKESTAEDLAVVLAGRFLDDHTYAEQYLATLKYAAVDKKCLNPLAKMMFRKLMDSKPNDTVVNEICIDKMGLVEALINKGALINIGASDPEMDYKTILNCQCSEPAAKTWALVLESASVDVWNEVRDRIGEEDRKESDFSTPLSGSLLLAAKDMPTASARLVEAAVRREGRWGGSKSAAATKVLKKMLENTAIIRPYLHHKVTTSKEQVVKTPEETSQYHPERELNICSVGVDTNTPLLDALLEQYNPDPLELTDSAISWRKIKKAEWSALELASARGTDFTQIAVKLFRRSCAQRKLGTEGHTLKCLKYLAGRLCIDDHTLQAIVTDQTVAEDLELATEKRDKDLAHFCASRGYESTTLELAKFDHRGPEDAFMALTASLTESKGRSEQVERKLKERLKSSETGIWIPKKQGAPEKKRRTKPIPWKVVQETRTAQALYDAIIEDKRLDDIPAGKLAVEMERQYLNFGTKKFWQRRQSQFERYLFTMKYAVDQRNLIPLAEKMFRRLMDSNPDLMMVKLVCIDETGLVKALMDDEILTTKDNQTILDHLGTESPLYEHTAKTYECAKNYVAPQGTIGTDETSGGEGVDHSGPPNIPVGDSGGLGEFPTEDSEVDSDDSVNYKEELMKHGTYIWKFKLDGTPEVKHIKMAIPPEVVQETKTAVALYNAITKEEELDDSIALQVANEMAKQYPVYSKLVTSKFQWIKRGNFEQLLSTMKFAAIDKRGLNPLAKRMFRKLMDTTNLNRTMVNEICIDKMELMEALINMGALRRSDCETILSYRCSEYSEKAWALVQKNAEEKGIYFSAGGSQDEEMEYKMNEKILVRVFDELNPDLYPDKCVEVLARAGQMGWTQLTKHVLAKGYERGLLGWAPDYNNPDSPATLYPVQWALSKREFSTAAVMLHAMESWKVGIPPKASDRSKDPTMAFHFLLQEISNTKEKKGIQDCVVAILDATVKKHEVQHEVLAADSKGHTPYDGEKFDAGCQTSIQIVSDKGELVRDIVAHESFRSYINQKWKKYGRWIYLGLLVVYIIYMAFLTASLALAAESSDPNDYSSPVDRFRLFCEIITLTWVIVNVPWKGHDFYRDKDKWRYFQDWTNCLDVFSTVCIFLIIPFRAADNDWQWVFASLAYISSGIGIFKYAVMLSYISTNVEIIVRIIRHDILHFVLILAVVTISFGGGLYFAIRAESCTSSSTECPHEDDTGEIYLVWLTGVRLLVEGNVLDPYIGQGGFRWLGAIIYLTFLFVVGIVLLSILIAQLSNSFREVTRKAQVSVTLKRTKILSKIETSFLWIIPKNWKKVFNEKSYEPSSKRVVAEDEETDTKNKKLAGKLEDITDHLVDNRQAQQRRIDKLEGRMDQKMEEQHKLMNEKLQDTLKTLEDTLKMMDQKMDKLRDEMWSAV